MSVIRRLVPWTAAVFGVVSLAAQTLAPSGGEFALHPPKIGDQVHPVIELSTNGNVMVWEDNGIDPDGTGIAACFINATNFGMASGIFAVNTYTQGPQQKPRVAMMPQGTALIAWEGLLPGRRRTPAKNESFMRILANGRNRGGETALTPADTSTRYYTYTNRMTWYKNTYSMRGWKLRNYIYESRRETRDPQPAVLSDGSLLLVYSGERRVQTNTYEFVTEITSGYRRGYWYFYTNDVAKPVSYGGSWKQDVIFQRYDNRRYRVMGKEVVANQFVDNNQSQPAVAVLPNGNFVIVWLSEMILDEAPAPGGVTEVQIRGRLFNVRGEPVNDEFQVNFHPRFVQHPAVAARADGGFTVVWNQRDIVRSNRWDIFARAFEADGTSSQTAYRVNQQSFGDQYDASIDNAGLNQVVVWTSRTQDGSREGVYGRLLSVGGAVGNEFLVNSTTRNMQVHPAVASDGKERFLVAWAGFQGASSLDLAAQVYRSTQPLAAPDAPVVAALSDTSLEVSWTALSGPSLSGYEVYVDNATLPHAVSGSSYLIDGLAPESTHAFRLAYVLNDGQRSLLSPAVSGTTLATPVVVVPADPPPADPPVEPPVVPEPTVVTGAEGAAPPEPQEWGTLVFRAWLDRGTSGLQLRWNTLAGRRYQIQVSDNLERWINLGDPRTAAGASDSIAIAPKEGALWFRIVELP